MKPKHARLERFEFLKVMNKDELFTVLVGLVPVIKIEDQPTNKSMCKYLIGTKESNAAVKSNILMVRVGGGFATIQNHLK